MVQLLVQMVAPLGHVRDVLQAFRAVMRPAQRAHGCRLARTYRWADDDRRIDYVEEWDDARELRGQFGSERFVRLLEVLEMAAERPVVEFRVIGETHGLEYVTTQEDAGESSIEAQQDRRRGWDMMNDPAVQTEHSIVALLADVDGTLVTEKKVLTARAIEAVKRLRERGVVFCITSGRPPRGLRMFVEPLALTIAMAAFNGGVIVRPDLSVIDERPLPTDIPPEVIKTLRAHKLDVWIYGAMEWYVTDPKGTRVDRETSTIQFPPIVVPSYDRVLEKVIKIVGVSDDLEAVARGEASLQEQFGTRVSAARSQPYYLDVTHLDANKGAVVDRLARYLEVPPQRIATIGDQPNDVLMFKRSGLSIAMGNASPEVQRQANCVTTSFGDEGFANAVERFVLPRTQSRKGNERT